MYPSYAYVVASAVMHVPVAFVECFVFTGIICARPMPTPGATVRTR